MAAPCGFLQASFLYLFPRSRTMIQKKTLGPSDPGSANQPMTRAPLRVMDVIATLARHQEGQSLADLSAELGLPKSSVYSLLKSLDSGGFVESSKGNHKLGPEMFALAAVIMRGSPFPANLHGPLAKFHENCGETVMLAVPRDGWSELIYVDVIESDNWLRFKVAVGARRPLYCTAAGLTLLAFAPAAACDRYLAQGEREPFTPNTLTTRLSLSRELATIRKRGVAISSGSHANVVGIGAPVFDAAGALCAATSLGGLSDRVTAELDELVAITRATGERMSRMLGYSGPYPPFP